VVHSLVVIIDVEYLCLALFVDDEDGAVFARDSETIDSTVVIWVEPRKSMKPPGQEGTFRQERVVVWRRTLRVGGELCEFKKSRANKVVASDSVSPLRSVLL